jgi:hypothetical protein
MRMTLWVLVLCVVAAACAAGSGPATTASAPSGASAPASASAPSSGPTTLSRVASPEGGYLGVVLRSRDIAKSTVSQANLSTFAKALAVYTLSHNDKYPQSLDELVKLGYIDARMLVSPLDSRTRYVYIPGATTGGSADRILIYEPVSYGGKVLVLRGDHSVQSVPEEQFQKELSEMKP